MLGQNPESQVANTIICILSIPLQVTGNYTINLVLPVHFYYLRTVPSCKFRYYSRLITLRFIKPDQGKELVILGWRLSPWKLYVIFIRKLEITHCQTYYNKCKQNRHSKTLCIFELACSVTYLIEQLESWFYCLITSISCCRLKLDQTASHWI